MQSIQFQAEQEKKHNRRMDGKSNKEKREKNVKQMLVVGFETLTQNEVHRQFEKLISFVQEIIRF